ncbi:CAAX prenyl protease-related protein [Duganella sp. PWIR1]
MVERASLARILPFALYMGFIVLADLLARAGVDAQQMRWLYPVKIAAVGVALAYFWRDYQELTKWPFNWRNVMIAVLAGAVVLVLWVNLDARWMVVGDAAGFDPRDGDRLNWVLVVTRWCGAALVVPVMEELFWRSFLMRWLTAVDFLSVRPAQVKKWAIVVTVLLFGFEHTLWLAGIVAGLVYSLLYVRSGSLWSPVLAHATTNGLLGIWVVATGQWSYW